MFYVWKEDTETITECLHWKSISSMWVLVLVQVTLEWCSDLILALPLAPYLSTHSPICHLFSPCPGTPPCLPNAPRPIHCPSSVSTNLPSPSTCSGAGRLVHGHVPAYHPWVDITLHSYSRLLRAQSWGADGPAQILCALRWPRSVTKVQ